MYQIEPVEGPTHIYFIYLPHLAFQLNSFPDQYFPAVTRLRVFTVKSTIRVLLKHWSGCPRVALHPERRLFLPAANIGLIFNVNCLHRGRDVMTWHNEQSCRAVAFVFVSWGFIGVVGSEGEMERFQRVRDAACRGAWLCPHSSAQTGIHPGTTL